MKKTPANAYRKENIRISRVADLADLEWIEATYISHVFSRHTHEGFAIGLIEDGVQATDYRGSKYYAAAGDVCLVNPGEAHTGYAPDETGWTYQCSYPTAAVLQEAEMEIAGHSTGLPYFPQPVIRDPALACLLKDFFISLKNPNNALERESRWLKALTLMVTRHAERKPASCRTGRERYAVRKVRDYLHEHYSYNITLAELADLAKLSRFHLIRVFRKETGLSPHAYLTQVRVGAVKKLLAARVPIAHAAVTVGFADQSHLTRHFKSITGITPGQYCQISNNLQDNPSLL